ncbi:MAG: FAD-dependent oxidoreductase, partial [Pseudomonadota bacterium]
LAKEGWNDVLIIEKGELTSGSTWHAAGQCPSFTGSYNLAKIHHYSNTLYPKLEAETGQYVSWHGCGGLRFAVTQTEIDWFHYVQGFAPNVGFHMEIIDCDAAKKINPYVNTDGVLAVAYTNMDGHVDPAGVCNALAIGARNMGVQITKNQRVIDIKRRTSGEWQVICENGDHMICEHVVNAAGCYARMVAEMVGCDAPITNMQHQYVVTEPIEEFKDPQHLELPVMRDPWATSYYRQEQKAGLIGVYEHENLVEAWPQGVPWEADHELFEEDLDRILPWLERVMERMPVLANSGIKRVVNGAIPHTPDASPLLGPIGHKAPNFWMSCGASIGIAQGAGCGKYLAQWMVHGQAEINMLEFDPRRFGRYATPSYVHARSFEDYAHMYLPHFHGEERPAGRKARISSLYQRLLDKGAQYSASAGWERPKYFSNTIETAGFHHNESHAITRDEVLAVRSKVGVIDLSSFSNFAVKGKDATFFLNHVFANHVGRNDGQISLAHLLNENGYIEGEMTVTCLNQNDYYLAGGSLHQLRDLQQLHQYKTQFDVSIEDLTEQMGTLAVVGPLSRQLLQHICDEDLSKEHFKWLRGRRCRMAGVNLLALRVNYVGELGWELHMKMEDMPILYDHIEKYGQALGMVDFGVYALNSMRLEKAYRGWGSELTHEISLIEADCKRFIGFEKNNFVGQKPTLERAKQPTKIHLVYFEVEDCDAHMLGGEPIFSGGRVVGVTTSGGYGHYVSKLLGFGYIDSTYTPKNGELTVQLLGEMRSIKLLDEPAYDPNNKKQFI